MNFQASRKKRQAALRLSRNGNPPRTGGRRNLAAFLRFEGLSRRLVGRRNHSIGIPPPTGECRHVCFTRNSPGISRDNRSIPVSPVDSLYIKDVWYFLHNSWLVIVVMPGNHAGQTEQQDQRKNRRSRAEQENRLEMRYTDLPALPERG